MLSMDGPLLQTNLAGNDELPMPAHGGNLGSTSRSSADAD
jgi:hypothetical protein